MFSRKVYDADPNCAFLSEKNAGLGVIANITSVRNRNLGLNCEIGMKLTALSDDKVENSPSELCSRFRNELVYVQSLDIKKETTQHYSAAIPHILKESVQIFRN
ncbi:hypothetical protein AVEN_194672-1 [Araneus ventricosus]|uniref:Uncharacterized protein n=1 Tax=Araneus ventricosus TaxID=182803 RepID=A0A4Y2GWQ1_ARAVE|nr:hypothetical protein AVEN_194672-1 [Araneus ventricosus]